MLLAHRRRSIPVLVLALALIECAVVPSPMFAQEAGQAASRDSAIVHGMIQDQESGAVIPSAVVTLAPLGTADERSAFRTADDEGRFRFAAVAPGTYRMTVIMLGYRMREDTLAVAGATEVRLRLSLTASPVPLDPLEVEVLQRRWPSSNLDEFEARRARLYGTFIDRAEIEDRNPRVISDLFLTVPSTQVIGGELHSLRTAMRGGCPFSIFVDGVPLSTHSADTAVPPDMVEAIEVYRSLSQIPPQYNQRNPCGVVLIWLRIGSDPVPPRDPRRWWKGVAAIAGAGLLLFVITR